MCVVITSFLSDPLPSVSKQRCYPLPVLSVRGSLCASCAVYSVSRLLRCGETFRTPPRSWGGGVTRYCFSPFPAGPPLHLHLHLHLPPDDFILWVYLIYGLIGLVERNTV